MERREWNAVRELNRRIEELQERLAGYRALSERLVPILDGLPRCRATKSRVEEGALKILECEAQIAGLKEEREAAKANLINEITHLTDDSYSRLILLMRYVECLSFRKIAKNLNWSLRQICRRHDTAIKKATPCHSLPHLATACRT